MARQDAGLRGAWMRWMEGYQSDAWVRWMPTCSSCRATRGCVRLCSSRQIGNRDFSGWISANGLRLLRSRTQPRVARQLLHGCGVPGLLPRLQNCMSWIAIFPLGQATYSCRAFTVNSRIARSDVVWSVHSIGDRFRWVDALSIDHPVFSDVDL